MLRDFFLLFESQLRKWIFQTRARVIYSQLLCDGRRSEMGKVWLFERTKIVGMFVVRMNDQTWIIFRLDWIDRNKKENKSKGKSDKILSLNWLVVKMVLRRMLRPPPKKNNKNTCIHFIHSFSAQCYPLNFITFTPILWHNE